MKIEQQVVSLKLAKKLKVSGYPQEGGLWYWDNLGHRWKIEFRGYYKKMDT